MITTAGYLYAAWRMEGSGEEIRHAVIAGDYCVDGVQLNLTHLTHSLPLCDTVG